MSKSNVNPNHYKVAGRERQGEDIAQARNKQKHAENLVRQRTEIGARSRKPAPQDGKTLPDGGRTRSATASRKTRTTPLQTPPGQKRGHNLVPGSSAPHARFPKAARGAALGPTGAMPQENAKPAAKRTSVNRQGANKPGKGSTALKRGSSHHKVAPVPATDARAGAIGKKPAMAGAMGKTPSPPRLPMRK